jgi:hypothetical protein
VAHKTVTEEVLEGFELSRQQKRLWLTQKDSNVFVSQCALLIEGNVNHEALSRALRELIARHEILRTSFRALSGMSLPVQVISENADLHDRNFELSDDKRILTITQPALCADADSLIQLAGKLARYYAACAASDEISDEPVQYVDYSEWQHELWNNGITMRQNRRKLTGANKLPRIR